MRYASIFKLLVFLIAVPLAGVSQQKFTLSGYVKEIILRKIKIIVIKYE